MDDKLVNWIAELQSIAQAGLTYGKDVYDRERYQRIREITAEMMAAKTGLSLICIWCLQDFCFMPSSWWRICREYRDDRF